MGCTNIRVMVVNFRSIALELVVITVIIKKVHHIMNGLKIRIFADVNFTLNWRSCGKAVCFVEEVEQYMRAELLEG